MDEAIYPREDIECTEGFILVPRQVVERLANEDQLAAIMANGMAFSLMLQEARVRSNGLVKTAEVVDDIAVLADPAGGLLAYWLVGGAEQIKLREQAGRIALTLMADAGYDPRQAPETWRLLAPRRRCPRIRESTLKYPSRAGFQLSFLKLEGEPAQSSQPAP